MWQYIVGAGAGPKKKTGGAGAEAVINKVRLRNTAMNSNPQKQRTTSNVWIRIRIRYMFDSLLDPEVGTF